MKFLLPLNIEIPSTNGEFKTGLMFRESLDQDSGMLFMFDSIDYHSFHMKNTTIPLDIAFIDQWGIVESIKELQPLSNEHVGSDSPVLFGLEVNRGWFKEHNVNVGSKVSGVFKTVTEGVTKVVGNVAGAALNKIPGADKLVSALTKGKVDLADLLSLQRAYDYAGFYGMTFVPFSFRQIVQEIADEGGITVQDAIGEILRSLGGLTGYPIYPIGRKGA